MNIKLILMLVTLFELEVFCSGDISVEIEKTQNEIKEKCQNIIKNIFVSIYIKKIDDIAGIAELWIVNNDFNYSNKKIVMMSRDINETLRDDILYVSYARICNKTLQFGMQHVIRLQFKMGTNIIVPLYLFYNQGINPRVQIPYDESWTDQEKLDYFRRYVERLNSHV